MEMLKYVYEYTHNIEGNREKIGGEEGGGEVVVLVVVVGATILLILTL